MTAIYIVAGYLLAASLIGLIPATLARSKGRSFAAWWAVSVVALGIFTVIPVMMLRTHRCPECREVVSPGARVCWRCGHSLLRVDSRGPGREAMTAAEAAAELRNAVVFASVPPVLIVPVIWAGFVGMQTPGALGLTAGLVLLAAAIDVTIILTARRAVRIGTGQQ